MRIHIEFESSGKQDKPILSTGNGGVVQELLTKEEAISPIKEVLISLGQMCDLVEEDRFNELQEALWMKLSWLCWA